MAGMRDAATEASRVAAVVAAAQVSAADVAHDHLTEMIGSTRADTLTAVETERLETQAAINELRDRMDISDRDASSAWTDLFETIKQLRPPPRPGNVQATYLNELTSVQEAPNTSTLASQSDAQANSDCSNHHWGSTDRAHRPVTHASRARSERTVRERAEEMNAAHALDMAELHRPRATDTRAGVSIHLGRGSDSILPEPFAARKKTETSIIGRGSRKCHTGKDIPVIFTDVLTTSRYALTALFGGTPMDSEFGKSFVCKLLTGKYNGYIGITDSETEGSCAMTIINNVIAIHAHTKHASGKLKARAMRDDLLSCCSESVRPKLAAYPKDAPWMGLLQHFLQTCGPQDMRFAVNKILDEPKAERPLRTLH